MKLITSTLSTILVSICLLVDSALCGGFKESCDMTRTTLMNNGNLITFCKKGREGYGDSTWVSLRYCIANAGGNLVFRKRGGFLNSCKKDFDMNMDIPGKVMFWANCERSDGFYQYSQIDLNEFITNKMGIISCDF
ncbi:hypothetical protein BJ508DRAFT_334488 [Ascobolus immersus RN42]|uniref:Cyanovirin-N domain-containing protein n=1 Tax=Ascobolus immersus RN42 TaxID=1160509 RepID=A0A3N4HG06_ASCIM|nr:hypothetical protein BJ508DRAFT_334488 [Ascobolus immersus RN42]